MFTIVDELNLPVKFIGVGERIEDLKPFVAEEFVGGILMSKPIVAVVGRPNVGNPLFLIRW